MGGAQKPCLNKVAAEGDSIPKAPWQENQLVTERNIVGRIAPKALSQEALLMTARLAAERLVADLEWARRLTGEWANENLADALVATALATCLEQLSRTGCWGEANRLPSHELWRIAGPILEVGVLQHAHRPNPRAMRATTECFIGSSRITAVNIPWAGPLTSIFRTRRHRPRCDGEAKDPRALAVHCLQTEEATFHIVSVGAGPANDIRLAISLLPENHRARLRVTLLDLDPEALAFARQQVEPLLLPGSTQCIRENLNRLPRARQSERFRNAKDLLGLFGPVRLLGRRGRRRNAATVLAAAPSERTSAGRQLRPPQSDAGLHGVDRQLVLDLPNGGGFGEAGTPGRGCCVPVHHYERATRRGPFPGCAKVAELLSRSDRCRSSRASSRQPTLAGKCRRCG